MDDKTHKEFLKTWRQCMFLHIMNVMKILYLKLSGKADVMAEDMLRFDLENEDIRGCIGCGKCIKRNCCSIDDVVNRITGSSFDAVIINTDVVYGHLTGRTGALLERIFHSCPQCMVNKPVVCCMQGRRAGSREAEQKLQSYFEYACMPYLFINDSADGDKALRWIQEKTEEERTYTFNRRTDFVR